MNGDTHSQSGAVASAKDDAVKYSICICNYNMSDTIEAALTSVLRQLDDRFEVVVVDDGSDDDSVEVLTRMAARYPNLRIVPLARSRRRLLGETRNVSIREARGEYVLPQFDCDDVYDTCICDFVEAFHQIEGVLGRDVYLKGQKLNIGRRSFLLEHGPYRNMFKEDRDMWQRLAERNAIIFIDHAPIFRRLPKTRKEKLRRLLSKTWGHLQADYRSDMPFLDPFRRLFSRTTGRGLRVRVLRALFAPFAYVTAQFMEPLPVPESMTGGRFAEYRDAHIGTFEGIMHCFGGEPDFSRMSERGKAIFR